VTELTLADYARLHAAERPDAVAFLFEQRETRFAAFDKHASQIANGLIAAGIQPGERVVFLGRNSDHYFAYWAGAAKAGAVMVPVNWRLAPPEVAFILADCNPRLVVTEPEFIQSLPDGVNCTILTIDVAPGFETFSAWRDRQQPYDPRRDGGWNDVVLQLYTSGTTGNPKGAMLTNRNLFCLRTGPHSAELPDWYRWGEADVALVAMPVYHISGSGWGLWSFQHGARAVVVREFDPLRVLDLLVRHRITKLMMVPTALKIVCDHPAAKNTDFSFLKTICYGGAIMPLDLLRQAIGVFGCGFAQMYGMTETAGTITGLAPEDHDPDGNRRMAGIGRALPGVEIRIVDSAGSQVSPGDVGEILVRSDVNMAGYYGQPEATAETIDSQGWLRTGDAGSMDEDGYLYLADRIKDMIITGGENVYPAEVENALLSHPGVRDAAVIGVPDSKWGETVKAIVVLAEGGELSPDELIAWARARIAAYKAPKSVEFRSDLPRNSSGKLLRRLLREEYR
jgi:acyl-CoA synthetase (AMP-forming)/AMP-acid ligase II